MQKNFLQKIIGTIILGLFLLNPIPTKASDVVVLTLPVTDITSDSAIGHGTVTGTGITEKGIVWGTNPNPRTWDWGGKNKVMLPGGAGEITAMFSHNSPNTNMHVRAYAIVPGTTNGADGDHWYGQDIVFPTSGDMPLTGDATSVADTEAVLSGSTNPSGVATSGYFRYSYLETPPIFCNDIFGSDMKSTFEEKLGSGNSPITFSRKITGLDPGTTYYFCAVSSTAGQIQYGGIKSFTTIGAPGSLSVTTNSALVKNNTSAFLNGSYVSGTKSNTWFEYRKYTLDESNKWNKVNQESHMQGDSGKLTYELTGLTKGTKYEFRAAILDTSQLTEIKTKKSPSIIYGDRLTFTTKEAGNIVPGPVVNGVPNTIPCDDPDDGNCNGTGGTPPGGGPKKPDLTAGRVTPSFGKVNTPISLMSLVRNQGNASTLNSFFNFFQISLVNPIENNTNTTPGAVSFKNILKPEVAYAANTIGGNASANIINLPPTKMDALLPGSISVTSASYTFSKIGTYYVRACADKNAPGNTGSITESNEANNCSPWGSLIINIDGVGTGGGGTGGGGGGTTPPPGGGGGTTQPPLVIGQNATPPIDAVVHYHEGIETVLQRQIIKNTALAKTYGYEEGTDINAFGWYLADFFARIFGYVSDSGKEIRVAEPDIAAYQIDFTGGKLTIYEYYASKIVNIQQMTPSLRGIYGYEYYFLKR